MQGRNDPCECGSGKKFKQCCIMKTSRQYILEHSGEYPIEYVGYTKEAFEDCGIGTVIVVRKHDFDKYFVSSFLCDIYCLGVKDTFTRRMNKSELEQFYLQYTHNMKLFSVSYETARSLVLGSVAYAQNFGITSHNDYSSTSSIIEPQKSYDPTLWNTFGVIENGKRIPMYQPGPYDKKEKILKILESQGLEKDKDFLYVEGPLMGTSYFMS